MRPARRTETVVVGAGQAGLALSWHLTRAGHAHVVLERGRIGERWRSERWESLSLLTPNWANRLPGQEPDPDPDRFSGGRVFASGLDRYASSFGAPVVEGATVLRVADDDWGFLVETDAGAWRSGSVVIATGDCDVPYLPTASAGTPAWVASLHASSYRAPHMLPNGGVLVVGAGPSGQQLALELTQAGRDVTIAVGRHARLPRRYRGRDIWEWLAALGDLDATLDDVANAEAARRTPSLALSGARGGERLDLGVLGTAGVRVTGRLRGFAGRHALFDDNLGRDMAETEGRMRRVLGRIDDHIDARAVDAPPIEEVPTIEPIAPPASLDLQAGGIGTVLWATGYRRSYPWLDVPALDAGGELVHQRGVTPTRGLYVLGLKFQRRRSSHFIGGVGADAELLTREILALADRPAHRRAA